MQSNPFTHFAPNGAGLIILILSGYRYFAPTERCRQLNRARFH